MRIQIEVKTYNNTIISHLHVNVGGFLIKIHL